jgi:hypothetical protein
VFVLTDHLEIFKLIEYMLPSSSSGGSLTVQLFGSAPEKSKKVEPRSRNALETTLKQQDRLSLSVIPVDSRKNIGSQLER